MDQLLKQISELKFSVSREKELSRQELEERTKSLKQYASALDDVIKTAERLEIKLKGDLTVLMSELDKANQSLTGVRLAHSGSINAHELQIKGHNETIAGLNREISDLKARHDHTDRLVDGLTEERRVLEEQNIILRGQNSALERRSVHLTQDCDGLQKKVDDLLKKEAELINSTDTKKRDYSRLSADVATLEKRAK